MVLIAPLGIAIVAAWVAGGSFRELSRVRFRYPVLLLVGILGEAAGSLLVTRPAGIALTVGAMGSSVAFLLLNARHPGMSLAAVGVALNALVIALNSGMPVSASALADFGFAPGELTLRHVVLASDSIFPWLGDLLYIPAFRQIVSAGDLLMVAGICWFVFVSMVRPKEQVPPGSTSLAV